MRTFSLLFMLLAVPAATLLFAPAQAARSLNQDPSTTVPAEAAAAAATVAAAEPAATVQASTGVSVDVEVDVEGASCAAVRNRVRNGVSGWFKRVFFLVNVSVDSARCSTKQGSVTVVVRVRVPGVAGQGVQVIVNVINGWVKTFVGVDAWAKSVKEINSLVKWADNRDYRITRVDVEVQA